MADGSPVAMTLGHIAWCWRRGMRPADVCASVGAAGDDWDDAFAAVFAAACRMVELPPRRLHLRPPEPPDLRVVSGGRW